MNYLFLILALAAEPTPVEIAMRSVTADLANVVEAKAAVAALSQAQAKLKTAQDALAASRLALTAALDAAASGVVVPARVVSLVCISSATCASCITLEPILVRLRGEGVVITITRDPADAIKWGAKVTPTLVMLVDGAEVSRSNGTQPEAAIREWVQKTIQWSKK